jgi:hypothetical protein
MIAREDDNQHLRIRVISQLMNLTVNSRQREIRRRGTDGEGWMSIVIVIGGKRRRHCQ